MVIKYIQKRDGKFVMTECKRIFFRDGDVVVVSRNGAEFPIREVDISNFEVVE